MFPGLKNYREKQNNKINKTTTKPTHKNIETSRRSSLPKTREEQGTVSIPFIYADTASLSGRRRGAWTAKIHRLKTGNCCSYISSNVLT